MASEPHSPATIVARRTAALALRGMPEAAQGVAASAVARRRLILWAAGGSLGALDLAEVEAVLPFKGGARLPTREPACLGVFGHAGRFYSVLDLPRLLGATGAGAEARAHLLLLRDAVPAPPLAFAVDRVLGSFDLPDQGESTEHEGRLVSILDLTPWRRRFATLS